MATATSERYVPAAGSALLTRYYDSLIAITMREPLWRPALIDALSADLPQGGTLVEVGCGSGTLTTAIATARPDATVIGVDGDPEILALARRKPGAERVTWVEGLAGELELPDGGAHVALCAMVLHHLGDATKARALADLARVIGGGGAMHVADWGRPRTLPGVVGSRALQVFDGREGPSSLIAGRLPEMLATAGFEQPRRWRTAGTIWGTIELWAARRP